MKEDNKIKTLSRAFALKAVTLYKELTENKKEYIMSKQILRSGTSIGANIAEAEHAHSKADWYAKIKIADKEASETEYWLDILYDAEYITDDTYTEYKKDIAQILSILYAIFKTAKL